MRGVKKCIGIGSVAILISSLSLAQDWPMYGRDLQNTHFSPGVGHMYNEPSLMWSFSGSFPGFAPTMADIDNDAIPEVLMGDGQGKMYAFNQDGTVFWSYAARGAIYSAAAVADINADGHKDVVFGTSSYDTIGGIYALNWDGTLLWEYPTQTTSSPAIADVDLDGKLEVVIGSDEHRVYCLDGITGGVEWSYTTGSQVRSSPAVADVDADDKLEVIFGTLDGFVYCLDEVGEVKWSYLIGGDVLCSPVVADLDGDNKLEVIIGAGNRVCCLCGVAGALKWEYVTDFGPIYSSLAAGDLTGNGLSEVVVGAGNGVYILAGNGNCLLSTTFGQGQISRAPVLADIDADGDIDMLVSADYGGLGCFLNNGANYFTPAWIVLTTELYHASGPVVGDINGDGYLEIAIAGENPGLYVFGIDSIPSGKGFVAGCVKDAVFSTPINGAYVRIINSPFDAYTNLAGKYLIPGVPAGMHRAVAKAVGYLSEDTDLFEVTDGDTTWVNFALVRDTSNIPGSISGHVVQEGDTIPIADAEIAVFECGNDNVVATGRSDPSGFYEIVLSPGKYNAVARAFGYQAEWYREKPTRMNADTLVVIAGELTPGIYFTLAPLAKGGISGFVIDTLENGIPFAKVWAQGINNWVYKEVQSDNGGVYFIEIVEGVYHVGAIAHGYEPGVYPYPVPVLPDSETSNIHIVLEPMPPQDGTISGIVLEEGSGMPIKDALVIAFAKPSALPFFAYTFTNDSGAYIVENVPLGYGEVFYTIAFAWDYIPEFYDNVYSWQEATPVGTDAAEVNFELEKFSAKGGKGSGPMGISGRILAGTEGLENAIIYAMDGANIMAATRSFEDGEYMFSQLPSGTYNLKVSRVGYEDATYGPVSVLENSVAGADINLTIGIAEDIRPGNKTFWMQVAPSIAKDRATISYGIADGICSHVHTELSVYDISGRQVVTLVNGETAPGTHLAILNTKGFAQGIYFVRLEAGESQIAKKILILR